MHLKCYQCTSCGINPVFTGLSPTYGQVTYALLTRAPVSAPKGISLDLHVLGLSLAFILSQDQTLRCILFIIHFPEGRMVRSPKNCLGHQVESKFIDGKAFRTCSTQELYYLSNIKFFKELKVFFCRKTQIN